MEIKLTLYSMSPWEERLESLVAFLCAQTVFRPERWGPVEPVRRAFTPDDLSDMQENWNRLCGLMFKGRKPKFWIDTLWLPQCKRPGWFSMGVEEKFFKSSDNVRAFLEFATGVYQWGDMVYGFACHRQDYERKNVLPRPTMVGGREVSVGGTDITRCLPGIYWANFFGRTCVEWFGEERIRSAPCHALEDLPDGGALILTADTPAAYGERRVQQIEARLRDHLGANAFFDKRRPTRPCRSPFQAGSVG